LAIGSGITVFILYRRKNGAKWKKLVV
jgi:hypothetical protein